MGGGAGRDTESGGGGSRDRESGGGEAAETERVGGPAETQRVGGGAETERIGGGGGGRNREKTYIGEIEQAVRCYTGAIRRSDIVDVAHPLSVEVVSDLQIALHQHQWQHISYSVSALCTDVSGHVAQTVSSNYNT